MRELTDVQNGDCFILEIVLSESAAESIGKYGKMRKVYL